MEKQRLNPRIIVFVAFSCFSMKTMGESIIGINWGRQTSHRLIPSMVVDLLLQNDIRELKLFSASDNVLKAFSGGDIKVTITLPNEILKNCTSVDFAASWLNSKVRRYQDMNINIRNIMVGNQPFTKNPYNQTYDSVVSALGFIHEAIVANGYDVVASIPHFTDILQPNITKPSQADFRPDLKDKMVQIIQILDTSNAPFVINMFPIYYVAQNNWDFEFAFINNTSTFKVEDNGLVYRNVFEFIYDSVLTAMAKAGGRHLKLTVGGVGWPTDGYPGANTTNAERFFKEFLPYVKSNKGTPLRRGAPIDVFIHSLADENLNKVYLGAFDRHWGVYRSNGEPKYKIDFTGQGRDIYPTTAKGVIMMPKRWCVFNGDTSNMTKVNEGYNLACSEADCTCLAEGGSCSNLDDNHRVSYAFNRYFQVNAQADNNDVPCDFGGLGVVVPNDPSNGTCIFPIEILSAEYADSPGLEKNGVERLHGLLGSVVLSLLLMLLLEWG